MKIEKKNLLGNPFIGVFSSSTDEITLLPPQASERFMSLVEENLKTEVVKTPLASSTLLGIFSVANQNGVLVPETAYQTEIEKLEEHFRRVGVLRGFTAIGNLVTCNQEACVASPALPQKDIQEIEKTLGVSVTQTSLAGVDIVGSCIVATNQGFLANPNITEEELNKVEKILSVPGRVGSLNYGNPFVKGSIIANSKGAIVGSLTTSYEVGRVDEALFLGRS